MILKGSQRAGAKQLAAHLLNDRDNEHVRVHELRGFIADDLHGCLTEAYAISRGTKCKQFMFSLSLNPPKGVVVGEADFTRAADEAEKALGLDGQPRAIVFHEKEGRRHAHVVWSRIDADQMKAVNLPHFKSKLTALSRELFLEYGWTLPEGLRSYGGRSPLNFTLAEWQQAKRLGLDPREIKDIFRDAWARSDTLNALKAALEERGYFLARGDRRDVVAVDTNGEVFALARQAGVRTKEVRDKIGDGQNLPSVAEVTAQLAGRSKAQVKNFIGELRIRQAKALTEQRARLSALVATQRAARTALDKTQAERWERETRDRAARFRKGIAGLWDTLTGRRKAIRAENEAAAIVALARDRDERDGLAVTQMQARQPAQDALDRLRASHAQERKVMARQAADHRRRLAMSKPFEPSRSRQRRGLSLDH